MIIRSVVVSIFFLQMVLQKSPEQVAPCPRHYALLDTWGRQFAGGGATGPTECITRASTIGSIEGPSSRYSIVYVVVHGNLD